MNKLTKIFQIAMELLIAIIIAIVFGDIKNLQQENTYLKNEINVIQAKIKIIEETDDKLYAHIDTLGGNDMMLQSWIEEINCYLYYCRQEWNSDYE